MQSIQGSRSNPTVISEEKADSAFAPNPGKPSRLFLLDKWDFPEHKAESALGPYQGKPSRLFVLTWFSLYPFCPIL